ncbi:MAG: hypothetical protein KGK11_10045 [Sphingomonadales bacterium]|nr:hypothetical protein [Sphingomonadales bacterium]
MNQAYSVSFVAGVANTAITFAFRHDPSFETFTDVVVADVTNPGGNLILNGNFASGTVGTSNATDWTYANVYGANAGGTVRVAPACAGGNATCRFDGAVQAYAHCRQCSRAGRWLARWRRYALGGRRR